MSAEAVNIISIFSGIFSIAISVIAMVLSILFYFAGRRTELSVATSLTKIENQTKTLQQLSGRQIDKLMNHVFKINSSLSNNDAMVQLISNLSQMPSTITTTLKQPVDDYNNDDYILLYSALYFYTAQTNYWSQFYLPNETNFNQDNATHVLTKRMIDLSRSDFIKVAAWLENCDQDRLQNNPLYSYLEETRDTWRHSIKSSSEIFSANSSSPSNT